MSGPAWSDDAKYTICVDFDGVIHSYTSPWEGVSVIPDPPVPGAIHWLNKMARHFKVVIHTTRGSTLAGQVAVQCWLVENGAERPYEVTHEKVAALVYIDDRGYRFDGTNFPTVDEIHKLRPWNKRPMGFRIQVDE